MCNDFSSVPSYFRITDDFEEALKFQHAHYSALKNSLLPFGPIYTGKVTMNFPFTLPKLSMNMLTEKYTVIFSNLNASKIEFSWDGKKVLG